MSDITKAQKRMNKVFMKWWTYDAVMFGIYTLVEKTPDKEQKTLGINTKTNPVSITFNPNFINSINEEHLETVLAAEGFKLLLKHPTTRLLYPYNISSLSSNITANQMLNQNFSNIEGLDLIDDLAKEMGLDSDRYFEEYFRQLMDKQEDTEQAIQDIWDSMSDKQKEEMAEGGQSGGEGQQGQGEEGDGDSEDGEGEENGFQKFNSSAEALKEHSDPNSTSNKDWGENTLHDSTVEDFVNKAKSSSRMWGSVTGNAMEQIVVANTPKISYKEILKRFSTSVQSYHNVSSRMKVNRRFDLLSPGYRRKSQSRVIFAIDTSMSMSDEMMAEGMAVCNSLLKHSEVEYVLFDTQITRIEKKYKKAKKTFTADGRGGTDFQEVIDYAQDQKVDGLILFTDGQARCPTPPKRTKVLWLLTHKYDERPNGCNWGNVCHMDKYEM